MSSNVSPELTGGEGFSFEDGVVATYLTSLLTQGGVRGLKGYTATSVSVQRSALGDPLDDLIVEGMSHRGEGAKLSLQVKSSLTISSAATNSDFRQVVSESMRTVEKQGFMSGFDRVGGACKDIASKSFREAVKTCEWARSSVDASDFFDRLSLEDFASDKQRAFVESIREILADEGFDSSDERVFELLRHFVLMRFDVRTEGAVDDDLCVERLRLILTPESSSDASKLWQSLLVIARDLSGRAGSQSRKLLIENLCSDFELESNRSFQRDFGKIQTESFRALRDIQTEILGVNIPRQSLQDEVIGSLGGGRVLQIQGPPGTGKSALLKMLAERQMDLGTVWVLKSDRLVGPGWTGYSNHLQLQNSSLKDLLIELAVTSQPVLFVDGIDRIVESGHQKIILDILHEISEDKLLHNWRIVTSLRDGNIEHIRTWLPEDLLANGQYEVVRVGNITDEEALFIVEKKPVLRSLLTDSSKSKDIARRPFFLSVLSKRIQDFDSPSDVISEIDLLRAWWKRGGYNAVRGDAKKRQQVLCEMAQIGANKIGRKFRYEEYDPDIVQDLLDDGVVSIADEERSLFTFSHDIFFEWSFFYVCTKQGDDWLKPILDANESSHFARVVELISQLNMNDADRWRQEYIELESASCRNQWQRMWLVAPFSSAHFYKFKDGLFEFLIENDGHRFEQLLIWFRAIKSVENEFIITQKDSPLGLFERMRVADELAWPNDVVVWSKFITWCLAYNTKVPNRLIQDYIAVLQVWQNLFSKVQNHISKHIVELALSWLIEIESWDPMGDRVGRFDGFYTKSPHDMEQNLRIIVLLGGESFPEITRKYLQQVIQRKHEVAFRQIVQMSNLIVQNFSSELVELCLVMYLDDLPEKIIEEYYKGDSYSYPSFDRSSGVPGIVNHRNHGCASPIREPYGALFKYAPNDGVLLVRSLCQHVTEAWRQVCKYSVRDKRTPIPIILNFPWGEQAFWGGRRTYRWFRGAFAGGILASGLMALEDWAFRRIEEQDVDEVIHEIVEDNPSVAILGIAINLALETNKVSEVTLPFVCCQRLWDIDLQRKIEDSHPSNLFVCNLLRDGKDKIDALKKLNAKPSRQFWIQDLAVLFSISAQEDLYGSYLRQISEFPSNLPYWFEEEYNDERLKANFVEQAEVRVEIAKKEHYSASRTEDQNKVLVQFNNPNVDKPSFQVKQEEYRKTNDILRLLMWAVNAFKENKLPDSFLAKEAEDLAKSFDTKELFSQEFGLGDLNELKRTGVVGAAAALLSFTVPNDATKEWAVGILKRGMKIPLRDDEYGFRSGTAMDHPIVFVSKGAGALVRMGYEKDDFKTCLLSIVTHPNYGVAAQAVAEAAKCSDEDFYVGWIALCLGVRLAIKLTPKAEMAEAKFLSLEAIAKTKNYKSAITALIQHNADFKLPLLPDAWSVVEYSRNWRGCDLPQLQEGKFLDDADEYVDTEFLLSILKSVSVSNVIVSNKYRNEFLVFIENLLQWTFEKIFPPNSECPRHYYSTELFLWVAGFASWLPLLLVELDSDETEFVMKPIFARKLETDGMFSFYERLTDILMAVGVIDRQQVNSDLIELIERIVHVVISHPSWCDVRRNPSRRSKAELQNIIRSIFCVHLEQTCTGAARFANNDWSEVAILMGLVDQVLSSVGDVAGVFTAWLTLVERSFEHYEIDVFFKQLDLIPTELWSSRVQWSSNTNAVRLAALIQAFAEREGYPLSNERKKEILPWLDRLVDLGDRRSSALQCSRLFI
ncbi:AAA family ATPase [Maridesulfovibrio sp.]|uniref:AAA family ATPase n=1 Tax=Maridesulfovibrio sp. TaxID=2795000 RepID=UPI0039EFF961